MDEYKYLILINGQDKTDSVASFQFRAGKYDVVSVKHGMGRSSSARCNKTPEP